MEEQDKDNDTDLIAALLTLNGREEVTNFLRDLLTESELTEFRHRWQAARMLYHKVPYTVIEKELGLSSTTVARISKWLQHGTGGYNMVLERLEKNRVAAPKTNVGTNLEEGSS